MKTAMATIGPCVIDAVPIAHFSRVSASLKSAWKIVGPSAQRNLERSPVWAVIAAAYLEGLNHGSASVRTGQQAESA